MKGCATGLSVEQVAEQYGHEDAHAVDAFGRFLQAISDTDGKIPKEWVQYALGNADDALDLLPIVPQEEA